MDNAKQNPSWSPKAHLIVGIIIMIIFGFVALYKFLPNYAAPLPDLLWKQEPNLLALSNIERLDQAGLLFIRLQDGKEQFIAGNWQVNFSDSGAYVFGEFPEGYSKQTDQQIYFISNDRIHEITLTGFSDQITAVHEDPTATYIFIETLSEKSTFYCIAKRILDGSPSCQQLNINKPTRAQWNPEQEWELMLKTEEGKLYTYDPQEKKMHFISPDDKPEQHQQLTLLFTASIKPQQFMLGDQENNFWRFLNIVLVKNAEGWSWHRIPLRTQKIAWLADDEHLLIVEQHRLSILELPTNKLAPVIEEDTVGRKTIIIQHNNYNLAL